MSTEQPISAERQAELQGYLDRWQAETDHGDCKGPFDNAPDQEGVSLTGADVSWLAEQSGRDAFGRVPNLHLERADLRWAHLDGVSLIGAHLDGAILREAHLDGAILREAHLERADLSWAHLAGADLRGAWLDSKTALNDALLDTKTRLGDIQWSGVGAVNLTRITWDAVPTLGDEQGVNLRSPVWDYDAAVRAYRQLAAQLRAQGLSEVGDRFAERAQVCQRKRSFRQLLVDWRRPWRLPGDLARWLFSWFLALLAGYGYHPGRSVFWYLATIGGFAFLFFQATHGAFALGLPPSRVQPLAWYEALVLSVSSFHGRGFFQPTGQNGLGDPVAILAAAEAVFGLLIEISFIATFTQRFFGAK